MKKQTFRFVLVILVLVLAVVACGRRETPQANTQVSPTRTPAVKLTPGWYQFSNGNYVREIALSNGVLYAATGGGVVVWDLAARTSTKYTVLDGLPTNDIQAVTACPIPETRILFGTEYGLSIYDPGSSSFEQWSSNNSEMEDDQVSSLDCDAASSTLYIGYTWGLNKFNAAADTWQYLDEDAGLATDWVNQVAVIGSDTWVVSSFGVTQIKADGSLAPFTEDLGNIPDDDVEAVAGDADGNVWLAAFDGLMKYSGGEFKLYNHDTTADMPFLSSYTGVVVDSNGMIWAGNYFGSLCRFDPAGEKCLATYEDQEGMASSVSDLLINENGEIFYASDDGTGISRFDGSAWTAYRLDEIPPANQADALALTPAGTVFVGGDYGLMEFPSIGADQPWQGGDLDGHGAYAFFGTPGGMWVSYGEGVGFYDYGAGEWSFLESGEPGQGIASGSASAMTLDGRGRLWVGTSSGLTVRDGSKYTFYDLLNATEIGEQWSPRDVYSVLYDGKNVWVGASDALFRFDEKDEMTRWDAQSGDLFSLISPDFYDMALDQDGSILIAAGDRLLRFRSDTFSEVYQAESAITTLVVTKGGEWWLGTADSGVLHYDGSDWTKITTADGLPSNHFYTHSILVDDLGTIWFAPLQGGFARWVR